MSDYLTWYTRHRMDAQEMELDVLRAKVDRMSRENVDGERAKFEAYDDVLSERERDMAIPDECADWYPDWTTDYA